MQKKLALVTLSQYGITYRLPLLTVNYAYRFSIIYRQRIFLLRMLFEILLTTLLMIDVTDSFLGNTQDIIVTGMVGCGNRAQPNAVIELREYDRFRKRYLFYLLSYCPTLRIIHFCNPKFESFWKIVA